MKDVIPSYGLNALLYFLNYVEDVNNDPILPDTLIRQIKYKYKPELVNAMCEALEWYEKNQDFNYEAQLPIRKNNAQILIYLRNVKLLFQKEGIMN